MCHVALTLGDEREFRAFDATPVISDLRASVRSRYMLNATRSQPPTPLDDVRCWGHGTDFQARLERPVGETPELTLRGHGEGVGKLPRYFGATIDSKHETSQPLIDVRL